MSITDDNVEYDRVKHLNIDSSQILLISPPEGVRSDVGF